MLLSYRCLLLSDLAGIQTRNPHIRSVILYSVELRSHSVVFIKTPFFTWLQRYNVFSYLQKNSSGFCVFSTCYYYKSTKIICNCFISINSQISEKNYIIAHLEDFELWKRNYFIKVVLRLTNLLRASPFSILLAR